jgi:hypothetical protein
MAAGDLTNLAQLRAYPFIPADGDGGLLQLLLSAVSGVLKDAIGRDLVQTEYLGERYSHRGSSHVLQLRQWPIVSVQALTVDTDLKAATDFEIEAGDGQLIYTPSGTVGEWPAGTRHIVVDYAGGYSTIPPKLEHACCAQVQNEYRRAKTPGQRSTVLGDATQTWLVEDLLPEVRLVVNQLRERRAS